MLSIIHYPPDRSGTVQTVLASLGDERAKLYREGGTQYEMWVPEIGWIVTNDPSTEMEDRAEHTRASVFPESA